MARKKVASVWSDEARPFVHVGTDCYFGVSSDVSAPKDRPRMDHQEGRDSGPDEFEMCPRWAPGMGSVGSRTNKFRNH